MPHKISDETRQQAACLLAAGKKITVVAKTLGVDEKTVDRWKLLPDFRAMVERELKIIRERISQEGQAIKENRILAKRRRHASIMRSIKKRAMDATKGGAEWDESGFVVQRQRVIGSGDAQLMVTEFELDTGALQALNELEDGIAREKGDHKVSIELPKARTPEILVALAKVMTAAEIQDLLERMEHAKDASVS
jgi:hypothetical protein